MSHNYLNKNRTQELINTIRGHLSDIATVLSNLASGDARDNTKAPINHTQPSSTITAMTGYTKPQSTSAIAATDTLNEAIGKLEKGLDGAGGGGETIPPIEINQRSYAYDGASTARQYYAKIYYDKTKIDEHPIKYRVFAFQLGTYTAGEYFASNKTIREYETVKVGSYFKIESSNSPAEFVKYHRTVMIGVNNGGSLSINHTFDESSGYITISITSSQSGGKYLYLGEIIPIDFTAVTRVTFNDVTVWERP